MSSSSPSFLPPQLLDGLSVYQDVVLAGQTCYTGTRDCLGRWDVLQPYLPAAGTILDVGSNFGWFGLQISRRRPQCVVASVEADLRSAAVQRQVLQSHNTTRVCLLTARAGRPMIERFAAAGQRFEAVLCLSVLHWIPGHRELLETLGGISGRLLVEHPDPREDGAGVAWIRQEIGHVGTYLKTVFPGRTVRMLADWPSHRPTGHPRQLWLVGEPVGWPAEPSPGLDVSAALSLGPSWPPRGWWRKELVRSAASVADGPAGDSLRAIFTPQGLKFVPPPAGRTPARVSLRSIRRRIDRVPQQRLVPPSRAFGVAARTMLGRTLRWLKLRR